MLNWTFCIHFHIFYMVRWHVCVCVCLDFCCCTKSLAPYLRPFQFRWKLFAKWIKTVCYSEHVYGIYVYIQRYIVYIESGRYCIVLRNSRVSTHTHTISNTLRRFNKEPNSHTRCNNGMRKAKDRNSPMPQGLFGADLHFMPPIFSVYTGNILLWIDFLVVAP